jgi:Zn-dependent protease with chaperone function
LVSVVAGDVSGMSGLVTTAPIVLSSLAYTRAGERESDQYAFSLLRTTGYSPNDFGDAMQRFDIMDRCLRLREKDRDDAKSAGKPYKDWPNPMQNDESDTAPTPTPEGATRRSNKPLMREAICYTDPDSYIKGREAEIAALSGDEKPQTGYLHTHPVTQERIEAARAAAKQSP